MFKLMLLGQWHGLSDTQLEHALKVRLDFMVFTGFEPGDGSFPDATTICRFRNRLVTAKLAPDAVLCTDGGGALGAAARHLGGEHHALNISKGPRVQGAWHIQNANAYHGRLKNWMRRFKGVASSYLASYLGWFRALDRSAQTPRQPAPFPALAVGA